MEMLKTSLTACLGCAGANDFLFVPVVCVRVRARTCVYDCALGEVWLSV